MDKFKVCFISNYINHHQIPFCNAMMEILQDSFAFLQTQPMEEDRIAMGWQADELPGYVYKYYENPQLCKEILENSDVVIAGGVEDESYILPRLQSGKTVIRYSERLYRTGQWKAISPRGLRKKYIDHTKYRKKENYLLTSGAYVPSDFHIVRAYPKKMLTWGYFPETRYYKDEEAFFEKKEAGNILWAARFLELKHPELALETAKWLKERKCRFHMNIVGGGEMEKTVQQLYEEYDLKDCVSLLGYKSPKEVRDLMEKADIYLMTSDRNEGWGAVVNEAMNSGCAVIGNHMVGAVPFLIKPRENGMIYKDGHKEQLFALTEELIKNRDQCKALGKAAMNTIQTQWNAETAAKRLVAFSIKKNFLPWDEQIVENLKKVNSPVGLDEIAIDSYEDEKQQNEMEAYLEGEKSFFESGPCAMAPVISERRMYSYLMGKGGKK